jgi:hypothetical protein
MRRLLLDSATSQACAKTQHKFIGLPSREDATMTGAQAGMARIAGRWFVQECSAQSDGENITLNLDGPGWMWVHQNEKGFGVHQYVYFRARAAITGALDVVYEESARVASVWITPTSVPNVAFSPLSHVAARAQNPLTRILGGIAPSYVDSRTQARAEEVGTQSFYNALVRGTTITFNTASGQMDLLLGQLARGVVPQRPFPSQKWLANERQELHAGGLQIAGPYAFTQVAQLDAIVLDGPGIQYAAVCADVAYTAVGQLVSGQTPAGGNAASANYIAPGSRYVARLNPPPCDWALVTYSQGDATVALEIIP